MAEQTMVKVVTCVKVDAPETGDFIVYDEAPRSYLTSGKLYTVIKLDGGDAVILDDEGDNFDTYADKDFTAYKLVDLQNKANAAFIEVDGLRYDKVEGALRVGDYVVSNTSRWDITAGNRYRVAVVDSDGDAEIKDDKNSSNFLRLREIEAVYRRKLAERIESFVKFGRKVDEFKVGDLVQIIKKPTNGNGYDVVGSIHEIDKVRSYNVHLKHVTPRKDDKNTNTEFNDIKLVAPVERLS